MTKRVLLLDGDIFAFAAIVSSFSEFHMEAEDGEEFVHYFTDLSNAYRIATRRIEEVRKELNAKHVVFTWTDYTANWRLGVMPSYKGHRRKADSIRPCGLLKLKEKLAADYESHCWPTLEADDVMGILATDPDYMPGWEKIIVSEDKDMQTIPGMLFNPEKDYQPRDISLEYADAFHMAQALGGDVVDGYHGCPGIGYERGLTLCQGKTGTECYEHVFKSGARKGLIETRWRAVEMDSMWDAVVSHYERVGLNEDTALENARVARILRHGEYNKETGEVKLWQPLNSK